MLNNACKWFTANNLKINQNKTQKLLVSANRNFTDGSSITFLGLTIDDSLSWSQHIEIVCKRLSSAVFMFRQLKKVLDFNTLRMAYFALFHSKITYGIVAWGNSSHSIDVFILQKKVIRIIFGARYRDHCRPIFLKMKIMPLPTLYIYHSLIEIYHKKDTFSLNSDLHGHNTRAANCIHTKRFRLAMSKANSLNLNIYNHLPAQVRDMSLVKYKLCIKEFLLKHCFYNVEEYFNVPFHTTA